jgi:hypothetical protein
MPRRRLLLAAATLALSAATGAWAQVVTREAPRDVRPARLVVTLAPQATLNGQGARLSPGARIRDTRNLMVLPASITGQDLPVVYRTEPSGLVHEVWLLTEDEYARLGGVDPTASAAAATQWQALLSKVFATRN